MQQSTRTINAPTLHKWGAPVAGQGTTKVCRVCGAKRTAVGDDDPCKGRDADTLAENTNDYDPFA